MSPAEAMFRLFASQFPTPNVIKVLLLAESGAITWGEAAGVARQCLEVALVAAREEVARGAAPLN